MKKDEVHKMFDAWNDEVLNEAVELADMIGFFSEYENELPVESLIDVGNLIIEVNKMFRLVYLTALMRLAIQRSDNDK